jgi:hypothetical protein
MPFARALVSSDTVGGGGAGGGGGGAAGGGGAVAEEAPLPPQAESAIPAASAMLSRRDIPLIDDPLPLPGFRLLHPDTVIMMAF